ncbi:MAG TPA: adenylate/guanylate cyclase domain-containing protein [Ktedonobacteraceae bacterium]|nr:adenylate/guanylate cyclase domain-containing protein [Ktedonobacteraceae bacterium]
MRCPNCQTENPAGAKFCLECGNRLIACPNCGTINLPQAKFCMECGIPLATRNEGPRSQTQQRPLQLSQQTPLPQPSQPILLPAGASSNGRTQPLPELPPPEERRVVTIMFADIIGSTSLASGLEPEDMRAILTGYFNLMTAQIRKHGGTLEKYIGDAVMAVFGLPIAHEDDPDRAIRAALDMQQALANFNSQRQALDPDAIRLQMRIGIDTGEVATPGSGQERQDFLITGDAVNVAARLQQVANPDTILVGERTYLATREVFDFHALAPLQVKGKTQPIRAWAVQGLHTPSQTIMQHPRGIAGLEARLVGRELELTLMHTTYARVLAERHPHLITLIGTPGIGKSRLIREFIAREEEVARCTVCEDRPAMPMVLEGRCPPYGSGITYWPLIEILRTLLKVPDNENDEDLRARFVAFVRETLEKAKRSENPLEIANDISRSIGRGLSGHPITSELAAVDRLQRDRQRGIYKGAEQSGPQVALLRAWRVLLEALAQQQPLIIIIDDLQWADEALLDLLEYLADRVSGVPVLFLAPARPDFLERRRDWGGGRRNFTTIGLEALSREETGELVSELLNTSELPEALSFSILSRAEGNPFFVEEIVRMLIDQGILIYTDGSWRVSTENGVLLSELSTPAPLPDDTLIERHYVLPLPRIPDTIQGVLAARIDLLNQVEKRVLQHAAIIGRTFWLSALLELAFDLDADIVQGALNSLVQHDFIVETEEQQRSPVEHDRIFSFKHVLIRDVVYNNIPRTRRSLEHAQVAQWLEEQAAGQLDTFSELLAYHYQQALVTWSAALLPGAIGTTDAFEPANHAPRLSRAELRRRAITYLTMAGDQAFHSYHTIRAIQAYNAALEQLTDSDADKITLAKMYSKLGDAYMQRGSADESWQAYWQALRLFKEAPQADNTLLLHLYERIAELGARWLGAFDRIPDMQEVRSYIDAGLKLLEGQPENNERAAFLTYLAFWYIQMYGFDMAGRSEFADLALQSALEAQRIAEASNDTCVQWLTLDALGFIYLELHKYQDAHQVAHRRLKLADTIKNREEISDLYSTLGCVHEAVSDYPSAVMWFGRAWSIGQTMESPVFLVYDMIGRMRAWYQWDRWDEAREVAEKVLQLVEQYQQDEKRQLWALETLAVIAYRTGSQEEGDTYARRFKRLLEQHSKREEIEGSTTEGTMNTKMHAIYLASEDWTRAIEAYKKKLQLSEPLPAPEVLATLAELVVMTGENEAEQEDLCERAIAVAAEAGSRKTLAIAWRARGRLNMEQQQWDAAEQDLQRALKRFEELDLPWEQGQTLYCLGLLYCRRAGTLHQPDSAAFNTDTSRAHYYLERAADFFESLHAVHDADRARLALAQGHQAPV